MDREMREEYLVVIQAKDMGGHMGGLSGTTTVTVTLTDINDNPPKFSKSEWLCDLSTCRVSLRRRRRNETRTKNFFSRIKKFPKLSKLEEEIKYLTDEWIPLLQWLLMMMMVMMLWRLCSTSSNLLNVRFLLKVCTSLSSPKTCRWSEWAARWRPTTETSARIPSLPTASWRETIRECLRLSQTARRRRGSSDYGRWAGRRLRCSWIIWQVGLAKCGWGRPRCWS